MIFSNEKIDKNCIIQAFADDICVIISSESISQLENQAQKAFTKLMQKEDVVLLQEPYVNKFGKLSCIPREYGCFSRINYDKRFLVQQF